ncbi:hypothetical protein [Burkholderia sp. WSM2232]|uniref:hypothetical protein n=1 Tax=Burkholderia sp. WSM2232 TaxID=944436 RepID=UPI0004201B79|nr:hypothetical protein [Burkholderia sp. WSM2232]
MLHIVLLVEYKDLHRHLLLGFQLIELKPVSGDGTRAGAVVHIAGRAFNYG